MRDTLVGHDDGGPLFLSEKVRATHMQVIGASGTGKTKFLEHLIRQDILNGRGLCLLDPTGNLYRDLVRWCETKHFLERKPLVLFDPDAEEWAFGFNPLDCRQEGSADVSFHVDAMVKACAAVWGGEDTSKTPLLKRCLRIVFHALAEKGLTLLEAVELLNPADPSGIRAYVTRDIRDRVIREQWEAFHLLRPREFLEAFGSTANRLMEFLASERVRRILGQKERTLDVRRLMDDGAMLLVNLSSGRRLSEDNASLLGALLVSTLFLKARGRPKGSRSFYLYVDECSRFVSEDIQRILDEGRQFGLHLILAHQHLAQLQKAGDAVYHAVMTDARTKVVFGGLSPDDAKVMAETVYMGELDFEEAKRSLNKPVVVGHRREIMESATVTESTTWSRSRSTTEGYTRGTSASRTTAADFPLRREVSRVEGENRGYSATASSGESVRGGQSRSRGWSETMVPILEELPTSVFSLEEQLHKAAAGIRDLRSQRAIVKIPEPPSVTVKVATVEAPYAREERVQRFLESSFARSPFARSRNEADAEAEARRQDLIRRAAGPKERAPVEPDDFLE